MSKTTTSTQKAEPWKPAKGSLQNVISEADKLYGQGPQIAGFSPETMGAIGEMGQGMQTAAPAMQMWSEMAGGSMDPSIMADVKSNFGSNYAGGAYRSGLAGEALGRGAADALQRNKMDVLGMAPMVGGLGQSSTGMKMMGGQMLDAKKQQQMSGQSDLLKQYAAMMGGMGSMGKVATGKETTPWSVGDVGSAASGIGSLFAMSDRRLKTNINRIGTTPRGAGIYEFGYIWAPDDIVVGVMADEVPYAAQMTKSGFYAVDYGAI